MCLKSLSAAVLLFSAQLLLGNSEHSNFSGEDLMPYGWIQEKVDWTDAAHIWNPEKIVSLKERGEYTSVFATSLQEKFASLVITS